MLLLSCWCRQRHYLIWLRNFLCFSPKKFFNHVWWVLGRFLAGWADFYIRGTLLAAFLFMERMVRVQVWARLSRVVQVLLRSQGRFIRVVWLLISRLHLILESSYQLPGPELEVAGRERRIHGRVYWEIQLLNKYKQAWGRKSADGNAVGGARFGDQIGAGYAWRGHASHFRLVWAR